MVYDTMIKLNKKYKCDHVTKIMEKEVMDGMDDHDQGMISQL